MNILKIGLIIGAMVATVLATPIVQADIQSTRWMNPTFAGQDPFFQYQYVYAYKANSTATLNVPIYNSVSGSYINVTYVKLMMDWNANYTASGISKTSPLRINQNSPAYTAISFTVPGTGTASNLFIHSGQLTVNYTTSQGTKLQWFASVSSMAVYSSDQADAMSLTRQLPISGGIPCFGFKSSEAITSCMKAFQQASLGSTLYSAGDFAGAKTSLQNAVDSWNQALSNENSKGGGLELAAQMGGYGSLLLGVGAIVGGVAAVIYSMRRPRELRTAPTPSA